MTLLNSDFQEDFFSTVKFIVSSQLRADILLSLFKSDNSINNLKSELNKRPENISRELRKLVEYGICEKKNKVYSLTSVGILLVLQLNDLCEKCYYTNLNNEFWNSHSLKFIPEEFLVNIDMWNEGELIESQEDFSLDVLEKNFNLLSSSKNISLILPFFLEDYFKLIINYLNENKGFLNLIINDEVFDLIKSTIFKEEFENIKLKNNNFNIWIYSDKLELSLLKCDDVASLLLFNKDHTLDYHNMLISKNKNQFDKIDYIFKLYIRNSKHYL